jgi:hypothetical protein
MCHLHSLKIVLNQNYFLTVLLAETQTHSSTLMSIAALFTVVERTYLYFNG